MYSYFGTTLLFLLVTIRMFAQQTCHGSLAFNTNETIGVMLPNSNQYYTGDNGGYTWECWFRLNEPFDQQAVRPLIVSVDAVVFEDMWLGFGWNGGWFDEPVNRLVFKVDGPNSTAPSAPNCSYEPPGGFVIGTWYHAAGVMDYSNQEARLFLNGQLVDTKPITTPPITRDIPTYLSYCWAGDPKSFRGNMDEVRIWDRPRTDSEIATYYNQCVDESDPNLFVYYHCNQASGSTTVMDATANANNGTFEIQDGWSIDEPVYAGNSCSTGCVEICGNGVDDDGDGVADENCNCLDPAAGPDTAICSGYGVQLYSEAGFETYNWTPATGLSDPTIANPVATPTVSTDYVVTASMLGPELVFNPDFSLGNTGFTSGQFYSTTYTPCNYYVNNGFFLLSDPLDDHTPTADGIFMSIDGCSPATVIWSQTISGLEPNTNYTFSFWATQAAEVQPDFEIHFIGDVTGDFIAGTQAGIPTVIGGPWIWDEYGIPAWNSGTNTSVTVTIVNLEIDGYGNDFGVDDFSFRKKCTSVDTVRVEIISQNTTPLNLGPDLEQCAPNTVIFTAPNGYVTYEWSDGSSAQSFTAAGLGTYWITVTDSCGNEQSDTVHITLAPPPTIDLGDDLMVCSGGSVELSYTGSTTFTEFTWTPSTGLSCDDCPNPTAVVTSPITYYLIASTADGCSATDSVTVTVTQDANIQVQITTTDATCEEGGIVEIEATSDLSDLMWFDFNHTGLSTEEVYDQLGAGTYDIIVYAGDNPCPLDTTVTLQGEDFTVYAPNSYTPNRDAINDVWKIYGNCIAELDCRIYNRWGEEIALLDDPEDFWDGTFNGLSVPDGIYTYQVRIIFGTAQVYFTTGHIVVLR